ncbi:MAG: hypothetical protein RKP73_04910 [Candidatus Contendobacter sp.]|nr:hypothetical protein [Candidatus Contendobacter sp.]
MNASKPYDNKDPLEQQAKQALLSLKIEPILGLSHMLQLVKEFLGRAYRAARTPWQIRETSDLLMAVDYLEGIPERAFELMTRGPESGPGEAYIPPEPDLEPEALAEDLIFKLKISLNALDALPKP